MTRTPKTKLPLLKWESAEEYNSVLTRLEEEIKPKGIIEEFYVRDMAALIVEIRRLSLGKANIIKNAYHEALQKLLHQLLFSPVVMLRYDGETKADELAYNCFSDKQAEKEVSDILRRFGLDAGCVEAEAIRLRATELESIDRMLALARSRFDRDLRCVTDYQDSFARRLRRSSDQIVQEPQDNLMGA